jgi:hypothetical protein
MPNIYEKILLELKKEHEIERSRIENWRDKSMAAYPRHVLRKVQLEAEIERLERLLMPQKGNAAGTASFSLEKTNPRSRSGRRNVRTASKQVDPEVAKRNAVVRSNSDASTHDLCAIFDRKRVLLPPKWNEAGIKSWVMGYKNPIYRKRIDVVASKARRKS